MSSFTSTLSIATSGLTAAGARANVAASNIANANTDGYSRRTAILDERTVGNAGAGVQVLGIQSAEAQYLTAERMRLEAGSSFASERSTAAEQLQNLIGEPGGDTGLFPLFARFETALRDASASPESTVFLREAVDTARSLTTEFQRISSAAEGLRSSADVQIEGAVAEVNAALISLEELNGLPTTEVTPAVQDQRQILVDRINTFIPVTVQNRGSTISLVTDSGVFLLTERARQLEFSGAGNVGRDQTLGAPLSGLSVDGVDLTPTGNAPQRVQSGQIAALFETRDTLVPAYQDKLDGLASDLLNRFADDAVDPTKATGAPGLFIDAGTADGNDGGTGIALRLSVNPAIDPQEGGEAFRLRDGIGAVTEGPTGNGDQLNRLIGAFTAQQTAPTILEIGGEHSASDLAAALVSDIAFDDRNYAEQALYAATRADLASNDELSAIGVDTDQELQELLMIEQAYAANARVIQTVNSLIDQLLSI